ncbi:GntR family transcriptional regulator [Aliiroseovarius sp. PTFE2010]|uniref:GntR family transcriptional regulator n=1 Tax=Aliiroseovarius sp. PTFE2010 TaxID=3417190 RepID=UPI003CEB3753
MTDALDTSKRLQSELIADQLASEIISGVLTAGSKLEEQRLTERFGVSRTPIREALHTLASRSLVNRIPYKGVVVASLSRARVEEMFEAMGEIEGLCGRFAAERMTIGERAQLELLHNEMDELAAAKEIEAYEATNTTFHQSIYLATHNQDMIEIAQTLRMKLAPFRKSQLRAEKRMLQSSQEHDRIVSALLDRDARTAEKALRRHMVSAAKEVLSQMD